MSNIVEIKVPDIGDFAEVDVIEVLVSPGDTVAEEDALLTLESDKASMDIPSPQAGMIKELKIAVGDKVSEGTVIALLEAEGAAPPAETPKGEAPVAAPPAAASAAPAAASYSGSADVSCQMLVLGAGPGGYSAAFRAADLGMSTVLVERWKTLGEVALAIELGADAEDIALTVHPHPTLCESVGMAAEVFEGTITDLYAPKKT